jgi:hypothetical protein
LVAWIVSGCEMWPLRLPGRNVIWKAVALQDVRESRDRGGADAAGAGEDGVKSGVEERTYVSSVECLTLVA